MLGRELEGRDPENEIEDDGARTKNVPAKLDSAFQRVGFLGARLICVSTAGVDHDSGHEITLELRYIFPSLLTPSQPTHV